MDELPQKQSLKGPPEEIKLVAEAKPYSVQDAMLDQDQQTQAF